MRLREVHLGSRLADRPASPRARLCRGLALLAVAAVAGFAGFAGVTPALDLPGGARVPLVLLSPAAVAVLAGVLGAGLVIGAWRRRGERFELYEDGFVRHTARGPEVFVWRDIEVARAGTGRIAWSGSRPGGRAGWSGGRAAGERKRRLGGLMGGGCSCEVVRSDGRVVRLDGLTPHARELGPVIVRRAREAFADRLAAGLEAGEVVPFGGYVAVSREALYAGGRRFPWDQLPELRHRPLRLDLGARGAVPLLPTYPALFLETVARLRPAETTLPADGGYPASPRTPAAPPGNIAGGVIGLVVVMALLAVVGALLLLLVGPVEPGLAWFAQLLIVSPVVCLALRPLLRRPSPWRWAAALTLLAALAGGVVLAGGPGDRPALRLLAATPLAFAAAMLLQPAVARYHLCSGRPPRVTR